MKLIQTVLLTLLVFLIGYYTRNFFSESVDNTGWQTVYKTDPDGVVVEGSTKELIGYLRKGYDLKLAWGWKRENKSIEHLADPIWIAIINEEEVIVHLEPQVLSSIDWEAQSANYIDSTLFNYEWRVVISTSGSFDAVWYNRVTNQVHRRIPQRHMTTWMINFCDEEKEKSSKPIFE